MAKFVMLRGGHYQIQQGSGKLMYDIRMFTVIVNKPWRFEKVWRSKNNEFKLADKNPAKQEDDHTSLTALLRGLNLTFENYPGPMRLLEKV